MVRPFKSAILIDTKEASLRRELPVLTPIILVYLFLAFFQIDHQSFWGDEVASLEAGAPDTSVFSGAIWKNGHGPLYSALLHIWMTAGNSELVVRSLPAFLGGVAVCLTYAIGIQLVNRKLAMVGALLFATSPFLIWYSQETRYITLAVVTSLLSMYTFHRAVAGGSFKAWLAYAITTTITLLSFVPNAFLVIAQGLSLVLLSHRRLVWPKWIAWQTLVGSIFVPWLLISYGVLTVGMTDEAARLHTGTPRELSPAFIPYTLFAFSSGFSMGPSVRELHTSRELRTLLADLPTLAPLTLLFGSLFVLGMVALCRKANVAGLLLLWLVVPIAGVLILAATTDVAYNVRYVCAAFPAYIFILAVAIATLRRPVLQATVLAAVLCTNGLSLANHYFNPRYAKEDTRAAAQYLESAGDVGDIILVVGNTAALEHYYKGELPIVAWDGSITRDQAAIIGYLKALSDRHNRLWIVTNRPWETDPKGQVQTTLSQWRHITRSKEFAGVEIYSYRFDHNEP
jgi:mannosyltransferase